MSANAAFVCFFLTVAGILAGMEIGWRQRAAAGDTVVLERTCPAPVAVDPFAGKSCAEAATACYSQRRMERVKKVQG